MQPTPLKRLAAIVLLCAFVACAAAEPWTYQNRYRLATCNAGNYHAPDTIEEVQQIVNAARQAGRKVKAVGALHSAASIVCVGDGGDVIWLGNMNSVKEINVQQGYVVVEPGIGIQDLQLALAAQGATLEHTTQYGGVTIGGAIATGAHGTSWKNRAVVADQVIGMKIVNGLGQLININTEATLRLARVHLGLLGVVVEVTLRIEPLYKLYAERVVFPEEIVLNGSVLQMAREWDFFWVNWFPTLGQAVVLRYNKVDAATPGNDYWGVISRGANTVVQNLEYAAATRDSELLCQLAAGELDWLSNGAVFRSDDDPTPKNPAVGLPYRILSTPGSPACVGPQCTPSFTPWYDTSFSIPEDRFVEATNFIDQLVADHGDYCFVYLGGVIFRFLKGSNNLMGMNYGSDHVMMEYITFQRFNPNDQVRQRLDLLQEINQALVERFRSKPHWGKNADSYFYLTSLRFPQSIAFQAYRTLMDPHRVFDNHFARLTFQGEQIPQTPGCALYERCACSLNPAAQSCGPTQFCGLGFDYKFAQVCRDKLPPGASCLLDSQCQSDRCFLFKCRD